MTECVRWPDEFGRTSATRRFKFSVTLHCVDCTHNRVRTVTQASHIIRYTYRYLCFAHTLVRTVNACFARKLVRTLMYAAHIIWYVQSFMLHTHFGMYRYACFAHNLVHTVMYAAHIIWYVPLLMLRTYFDTYR